VTLGPLLVLTDRHQCAPRPLADVVSAAVRGGARTVVLREKDLPAHERATLAVKLRALLGSDGRLLVASDPTIPGDGVHLAAADPFPTDRPPIVGRSCHSLAEVRAAAQEGCDHVTLSPIFPTASKPGYGPPLGLDELERVCTAVGDAIAVYALGGIDADRARRCRDAGATGVAVMGELMRSPDPEATTFEILKPVR
jgi:thiamine-phosphate pyrophosphorylase